MIKGEIPRNRINKNSQYLHKKIKILLKNTKKTGTNVETYHVHGKEDLIL